MMMKKKMVMSRISEDCLPFKKRKRFLNAADIDVNGPHPLCPHHHLQAVADRMRMPRLRLFLSKTITKTDTCRDAHRYQLARNDINNVPALKAQKQRVLPNGGEKVAVKLLDKHANEYDLFFSLMGSTGNCRIIGPDWTGFLDASAIRAGEIMNVYGSLKENGDFLFALFNTQQGGVGVQG